MHNISEPRGWYFRFTVRPKHSVVYKVLTIFFSGNNSFWIFEKFFPNCLMPLPKRTYRGREGGREGWGRREGE